MNCCGQQFCGHCLEKWLLKNKTCPRCRSANFSHMLMQPTIRKIKNLAIFCPKQHGCKVELSISQCERHLSTRCLYAKLECLNNCPAWVFRGEMQTHLQNECPRRSDSCTYCGKQGERQYIMGDHLNSCLQYPICCPKVCSSVVLREDLERHLQNECTKRHNCCTWCNEGDHKYMRNMIINAHLSQSAYRG